jgi:NADPH:quinone reductase-like Zn-dependent oxidoreductase
VGTFAVQIAAGLGAEVTGVCSSGNADLVRGLGAEHIIAYDQQDVAASGGRYDVVLDNVGDQRLSELRPLLDPHGILIPNSNKGPGRWVGSYLRRAGAAVLVSPFVGQRLRPFAATASAADLDALTALVEAGSLTPVIDRTYPLERTAEAVRYYGQGHPRGKVVITVAAGTDSGGASTAGQRA